VLNLLRYMAKHLGCRIADDNYPVPILLREIFENSNLHPFSVSFAVDPRWVNISSAEDILDNHALLAVFDRRTGQMQESYISGFSIGYIAVVYRFNYVIPFPWEGDIIESSRQLVKLGIYEPPRSDIVRIGSEEFELPILSVEQLTRIWSLHRWPSESMTLVENIRARVDIIHAILSLRYPNTTKGYLEENLDVPLSNRILSCY
jgi:hypothetical protein